MEEDIVNKVEINVHDGAQVIIAKNDSKVSAVQYNRNEKISNTSDKYNEFQNNMKQQYIDSWNSRLFLHLDNDESPVTLSDAFITPDYEIYKMNQKIGFARGDILDNIIRKFVQYNKTTTMLIAGVPGMGKSSIVSWIANEYRNDSSIIILRFRDWDKEELENGLLKAICITGGCKRKELESKTIILDGFDEMKTLDVRNRVLNDFLNDMKDFENCKCIITSRINYIDIHYFANVIEIQKFDIEKVDRFCKIISGDGLAKKEKVKTNLEVLGIPVILYMAIMSNIDISENPTKPELYNRIFAEEGGIFDKFCEYDSGSQIMRNSDNIICYLEFLRAVACKMFEKDELVLSRNEYTIPELLFQGRAVSILEFPIKHLFENTSANIEFIHKSIYEYFIAEYIYKVIDKIVLKEENTAEIDSAGILGELFSRRILSDEILEFLKYRIRSGNLRDKVDTVNDTFTLMLKDGMTYHTGKCYRNVIDCELRIFTNMLEIIHLWEKNYFKFDKKIVYYIKMYPNLFDTNLMKLNLVKLDLRGADLREANLRGANLRGADLRKIDLRKANLSGADLSGAHLNGANLREAILIGANLKEVELRKANLGEAILIGANLKEVKLRKANLSEVNLSEAILTETNLRGADLRKANLRKADLIKTNLNETNLSDADLRRTNLIGADLRKAILIGANLREADVREADLKEVDLRGADFIGADLRKTDLRGADLGRADLNRNLFKANFIGANLEGTIFDEKQIEYLQKYYDLQHTIVYIDQTQEFVDYEEYRTLFCN